jgi:hypothetical protein
MFVQVTSTEILRTGLIGSFLGAQVCLSRDLQTTLTSDHENIYKLTYRKKETIPEVKPSYNVKLKFIARSIQ